MSESPVQDALLVYDGDRNHNKQLSIDFWLMMPLCSVQTSAWPVSSGHACIERRWVESNDLGTGGIEEEISLPQDIRLHKRIPLDMLGSWVL